MEIITRADFDGLVCSALLTEAEVIDDITLVHPKQMQDGQVEVTAEDIIVNLPYHPDCGKWFDHHISESDQGEKPDSFSGRYGLAPSCARLVYEYYHLPGWERYEELLRETDRIDSGQLDLNDILRPQGWARLSNTIDPRTGFGRSKEYFMSLIDRIKKYPIERILGFDDVRERLREFFRDRDEYETALKKHSYMENQVVVTDFRTLDPAPVGSRFLVYALFPTANAAIRFFYDSEDHSAVRITIGRSILNRTCKTDIGTMLHEFGGGGHVGAGSCKVSADTADDLVAKLVTQIN